MPGRLDGRVVVVTGGGHGIGKAYCRGVAAEGARVVVAEIDADAAQQTAEAVEPGAKFRVAVVPRVAREPPLAGRRLVGLGVVAEGRRDDGAGALEQTLGMARALRLGHREPHVGEEAARSPFHDVALRVGVRLRRRRADGIETDLRREPVEIRCVHARIVACARPSRSYDRSP